jgi:hypothetical protein
VLPERRRSASDSSAGREMQTKVFVRSRKAPKNGKASEMLDLHGRRGLDEAAVAALKCPSARSEMEVAKAQTNAPMRPDFGIASIEARTAYVDAIIHAVPPLAKVFSLVMPEVAGKPLIERSTDELIAQIDEGRFLSEIACLWCVPVINLTRWIATDEERFARVALARKTQAALWDWVALQVLIHAPSDRVEIARAERIAQHCRWRAKVFNPEDYGAKIKVTQTEERSARKLTTRELEIIVGSAVRAG